MMPALYARSKYRFLSLRIIGLLFFTLVVLPVYIFLNLNHYSVYYAKHTPHADDINPAVVELVRNLYFNFNPRDDLYFDWKKRIIYSVDKNRHNNITHFEEWAAYDNYRYLFVYQDNKNFYYILDSNLNSIEKIISYPSFKEVKLSYREKVSSSTNAQQFIEPIIEAQPKPFLLNLQWLYDSLNYDRFN